MLFVPIVISLFSPHFTHFSAPIKGGVSLFFSPGSLGEGRRACGGAASAALARVLTPFPPQILTEDVKVSGG